MERLDARTIKELARESVVVNTTDEAATLTSDAAQRSAHNGLGHVTTTARPTQGELARVTAPKYGRQLEPDPNKPSRIDPIVKDRLAWVLVYEGAQVPISGPILVPDNDSGQMVPAKRELPDYYAARLAVIIDAATGEFLMATTL